MKKFYVIFLTAFLLVQCSPKNETKEFNNKDILHFDPSVFTVKGNNFGKARGQILYLPLYSNIPHSEKKGDYDLSGFLTIHNTDLSKNLKVTRIYYFNNNGELRKDFLGKDTLILKPLQSKSFFIPYKDKSGTGANFLVEWKTVTPVNIPLVETVMLNLMNSQGVSFLSNGKVIEQMD
jgi:hypothetical protein